MGGGAAITASSSIDRRFLLRTTTYTNYSLKREGKHPPHPNHESHSQINRPSSRQMRNSVERGNNVDITQSVSIKRCFVLSYIYMPFVVP